MDSDLFRRSKTSEKTSLISFDMRTADYFTASCQPVKSLHRSDGLVCPSRSFVLLKIRLVRPEEGSVLGNVLPTSSFACLFLGYTFVRNRGTSPQKMYKSTTWYATVLTRTHSL